MKYRAVLSTLIAVLVWVQFSEAASLTQDVREYEITYKIRIPVGNRPFGTLRAWVPIARSNGQQEILRREIVTSNEVPLEFTEDLIHKNEMAFLVLEGPLEDDFEISVVYHARSRYEDTATPKKVLSEEEWQRYLKPNRLVIIDQRIKELARNITEGHTTELEKARAIYDYVIDTVRYDKSIPGYGRGDTARVCLLQAGNCTDFHSLFISIARAANIPARFHVGFTVPQGKKSPMPGYHCWAEFYTAETGWQMVDASEAWKDPQQKEFYFGNYDPNKFLLTTGRDIELLPMQENEPINIFFYPHVEIDGKAYDVVTEFEYRSIKAS